MFRTILLTASIFLLAGCQQQTAINHADDFAPDDQPKAINRQTDAQAERGAGADATLYACHFDGANLNSLGKAKLDLILKDSGGENLTLWMALPDDASAQMRRLSVAGYLKDHGVAPEQVTFGSGANPDTDHPAAQSLKDLAKTDSDANDASSASSTGDASSGGAAAATPGATASSSH
jgi:hypothetical protein